MSLRLGIVGLPNSGKSTLFNALTRAGAAVAPYAFTTVEPNIGVAALTDPRLIALAELIRPERVVPAAIEFVDIAGLVRGAHRGEGLGNQFLGHIRNVDAVILVARCFDDNVPHPYGQVNPMGDLEILDLELALADLASVERRLENTHSAVKAAPGEHVAEVAALESLRDELQAGRSALAWGRGTGQSAWVREWNLLSGLPRLLVANVGEESLPSGGQLAEQIQRRAVAEGGEAVVFCAQTEMELLDWAEEESEAYWRELGGGGRGLDRLVAAGFRLLDLITFFTIAGDKEARAWPIAANTLAPAAAGKVHTDMERGFIRAEVVQIDELLAVGSWTAARDAGRLRIEGRSYAMQDGDVVHFRFAT